MTLDYNNSRVKTKTRVGDKDEISSYNKIVGSADYCIKIKLTIIVVIVIEIKY